jgi:cytochrome c-type biogenesis protein CcmH
MSGAATPGPSAASADELEERTQAIARELRCLVCQNESIADSRADLANDLRSQVREMLRQGASREEILRFMTDRYGDFVRYQPPLRADTALLWGAPFLFVAGGALALGLVLRRRQRLAASAFEPSSSFAGDDPQPPASDAAATAASIVPASGPTPAGRGSDATAAPRRAPVPEGTR